MLLPIRHPKRPKKREYEDLFSVSRVEKTGKLSPVLFPVESDGFAGGFCEQNEIPIEPRQIPFIPQI